MKVQSSKKICGCQQHKVEINTIYGTVWYYETFFGGGERIHLFLRYSIYVRKYRTLFIVSLLVFNEKSHKRADTYVNY